MKMSMSLIKDSVQNLKYKSNKTSRNLINVIHFLYE